MESPNSRSVPTISHLFPYTSPSCSLYLYLQNFPRHSLRPWNVNISFELFFIMVLVYLYPSGDLNHLDGHLIHYIGLCRNVKELSVSHLISRVWIFLSCSVVRGQLKSRYDKDTHQLNFRRTEMFCFSICSDAVIETIYVRSGRLRSEPPSYSIREASSSNVTRFISHILGMPQSLNLFLYMFKVSKVRFFTWTEIQSFSGTFKFSTVHAYYWERLRFKKCIIFNRCASFIIVTVYRDKSEPHRAKTCLQVFSTR